MSVMPTYGVRLAGVVTMVLLAGCAATPPTRCVLGRATSLPIRDEGNKLYVATTLNGAPADLMIDTGADMTMVTQDAARRLALSLTPTGASTGIGGSRAGYAFVAHDFQLGELHGTHLVLAAGDFDVMTRHGPAAGLLGDNFLAAYDVDLDLPAQRMVLYLLGPGCAGAVNTLSGDVYHATLLPGANSHDSHPYVDVVIDNVTFKAVVDTGSPHSVLFRDTALRAGLKASDLAGDQRFRTGGLGPQTVAAIRHVIASTTVGDITIRDMPVAVLDQPSMFGVDMILGLDFLRQVHAWFSFSSHTLLMQYPPQPSGTVVRISPPGRA